MQNESIVVSSN